MRLFVKALSIAVIILAIGPPVLDTWRALLVAAGVLMTTSGVARTDLRRLAGALVIVAAVLAVKAVLPRADIAEAHNAFTILGDGEPLQQGLPAQIFASWRKQFDALYPPADAADPRRSQWRFQGGAPTSLFTRSSDAIWRKAKYTRQVDAIAFHSLAEFRGGFANEIQYNFWAGDMLREWMPFYVMYELTPASAGSGLKWKGQVFWERHDGGFEELTHTDAAVRTITAQDAGKRVFAVFFPKRDARLYFELEPSAGLRAAGWLTALLTVAAVFAVLALLIQPRWHVFVPALVIFAFAYLVMISFLAVSEGKYLGRSYPPHGGGDDGLAHESYGRTMAMLAGDGRIADAMEGGEPIYWFTPGTRYFRMVENLIFGDTNHLYALVVSSAPVIIFYLIAHFLQRRWAWILTGIFCVLVVGNFSYLNYLTNAKLGYGEALACELFLLGLVLVLRAQPDWGGREPNRAALGIAGAAFALSMFVRPNFALAVVWLALAVTWAFWKQRDRVSIAAFGVGLAVALWMPFHNWFYGHQFYLISRAGSTVSVPLGVRDYVSAVADLLRGHVHTTAVTVTSAQVKGWLWNPGLLARPQLIAAAWAVHLVDLFALGVTVRVVRQWIAGGFAHESALAVIAVTAICAQIPMLFIFTTHFRYAMLGWDLCIVVLVVWASQWHDVRAPAVP